MPHDYVLIQKILAAILVGYLLGSIPFAYTAARWRGVDIFAMGNRMAGTANVFWNVGHRTGALVFAGDVAKGSAAVVVAGLLELPAAIALLSGGAAIAGHWKSVFAGFRGGDGMATLMGVTLALEPALAPLGIVTGLAVILLLRRSRWRSSWGIAICFAVILALSQYYQVERGLVVGLAALAALVLVHSTAYRRLQARASDREELVIDPDSEPESELGPAAPSNR